MPLCSPISAVRKSATACVKTLRAHLSPAQASPVTALTAVLADNAVELATDPEQLHRYAIIERIY